MQIKNAMRKHFRDRRNALSDPDRVQKSERIVQRLRNLPEVAAAKALLVYVSADSEVNTHGLIASAIQAGIEVFVPVLQDDLLHWSRLHRFADLDLGQPYPVPKDIDLHDPPADTPVVVPGIAFDRAGNRLGQGGGHFDRFLEHHRGPKIGVAFDVQIADDLPAEPHDIPMDYLVTESKVVRYEA